MYVCKCLAKGTRNNNDIAKIIHRPMFNIYLQKAKNVSFKYLIKLWDIPRNGMVSSVLFGRAVIEQKPE